MNVILLHRPMQWSIMGFNKKKSNQGNVSRERRRQTSVPRSVQLLPDTLDVSLKYCQTIDLTSSTGSLANWFFRGNDLYDPDLSGTGHQPLGFDQYCSLYLNFVVESSSIRVLYSTTNTTTPIICAVVPSAVYTTPPTYITDVMEWPRCKSAALTGYKPVDLRGAASTRNFFSADAEDLSTNSALVGSYAASPTNQWYWRVYMQASDLAGTAAGQARVEIVYRVRFLNPRLPGTS